MMLALVDSIRLDGHFGRETSICMVTHPLTDPRTDNGRVLTSVYNHRRLGRDENRRSGARDDFFVFIFFIRPCLWLYL